MATSDLFISTAVASLAVSFFITDGEESCDFGAL